MLPTERTGTPVLLGSRWLVAQNIPATTAAPSADGGVADASADVAHVDASADGASAASGRPGVRLFAGEVPEGANAVSQAEAIGDAQAAAEEAHITACRTETTLAVVVRGANGAASAITFFEGGHWSAPVLAETARASMSCRAHEVSFTWLETSPHRWVRQVRCTAQSCAESHGSFPTFQGDVMPVAVDLDGKVLLLASPGPGHGLVMVYAPVEAIGRADRRVIFDDGDHNGLDLDPRPQVYVRGGAAVALVSSTTQPYPTYVIRFDPQGNFRGIGPPGAASP
jgi:hypothetical protein